MGEIAPQNCIVLTSREKPQEVITLEGEQLPVWTPPLSGLGFAADQLLLKMKGIRIGIVNAQQLIY